MKNLRIACSHLLPHATVAWLLLLACGGGVSSPGETDAPVIERDDCDDNPLLAICDTNPDPDPVEEDPTAPPPDPNASVSELELARAAAENVLRTNCGQCHGPQLTPAAARAGMNYIDDVDELVSQGKIVPLNSASSPIVARMREGSMPPLGYDGPRPSASDIELVTEFVDNPQFWPEYRPVASCEGQLILLDELYETVLDDLRDQESDDRPFMRYVTLVNRYNAGVCAESLDRERFAIAKLVNALSTRTSVRTPTAIDDLALTYRIDMRDYDWDRDIEVNGNVFRDGWEAIIDESPYAVPLVGDQVDDIRDDTETDVPLMNADALLDVAALGNLYYALIDVDVNQSLGEFLRNELAVDVEDNIADGEVIRAGTTRSAISREDRVVERHELGRRQGAYWQSFDFAADQDGENIFLEPFSFNQGGTQAIFSLPNGLMGFVIADENDSIVAETNLLLDTFQDDFIVRTSVSCSGCHAQGFNMVTDEVRPFVLNNRLEFNRDEIDAVNEIYLDPPDFQQVIEEDSAAYLRALAQADVPTIGADPVSRSYIRFNDQVDLATAAGDLGVSPEILDDNLSELDPRLLVLRQRPVSREDFTERFQESLCIMQIVSVNHPDPDLCAAILDD